MKKMIGTLALLIILLGAAALGYRYLSAKYAPAAEPPGGGSAVPAADAVSPDATAAPESKAAPDFTVLNEDGEEVSLSDYLGQPVVVNFWASWCGPCKQELPDFDAALGEYPEVVFLMVNLTDGRQETVEGVTEFARQGGYAFPLYFDTEQTAAVAYGVNSIPRTYFIRPDGTLAGGRTGMIDGDTLRRSIEALIGGEL